MVNKAFCNYQLPDVSADSGAEWHKSYAECSTFAGT